jgi:cellobiose-specific phosphotransferase system component IIA
MIKSPCPALLGCSARQRPAPAAMPASSGYDTVYSAEKHAGNALIHVAVKAFHAATGLIHASNDTVHASFALIHAQNRLFAA